MSEVYIKRGATRRIVISRGSRVELRIRESGRAVTRADRFEAAPFNLEPLDSSEDPALDRAIEDLLRIASSDGLSVRRLSAADGISEQTIELETKRWTERHARIALRVENRSAGRGINLLLGAADPIDLTLGSAESAARALSRFRGELLDTGRIALSSNVTAELWTHLAGYAKPTLSIGQGAHGHFSVDGSGNPVGPHDPGEGKWPNTFRPSYRYPAVTMPLHLTARGDRVARRAGWKAVALLEPFQVDGLRLQDRQLRCTFLATDERSSRELRLAMTPRLWMERLALLEGEPEWFPYRGGSWGCEAEVELESSSLQD